MREKTVSRRRRQASVRIVSGADVPQVDLETLFQGQRDADSLTGSLAGPPSTAAAMTGGGAQTPVAAPTDSRPIHTAQRSNTVALADGTRITFAAEDWVRKLESA
jgi:hypothetical protein